MQLKYMLHIMFPQHFALTTSVTRRGEQSELIVTRDNLIMSGILSNSMYIIQVLSIMIYIMNNNKNWITSHQKFSSMMKMFVQLMIPTSATFLF
jgi:hypothetical protein